MGNSFKRSDQGSHGVDPTDLTEEELNDVMISMSLTKYNLSIRDQKLITCLLHNQHMFVITDPALPDNPLIYCSQAFCELTEYSKDEILGRNCRFLQGSSTTLESIGRIRKAIETKSEAVICLLNYKKSGQIFNNHFFIAPIKNSEGKVILFLGIQRILEEEFSPGHRAIAPSEYLHNMLKVYRGKTTNP